VSRPAPATRAVAALAALELRLTDRRGVNVLVTIHIPSALLVFFSTVGSVSGVSGPAVDFLLPGALALAIIASGLVSLGIATAYERSDGVLKRLGGSPLPRWGLGAAKGAAVLVHEVDQVGALHADATALGWRLPSGSSAGLFAAGLLLGTVAFAGLGLLLAGTLRAEATLALANGLFLVCLMLGGIVLPVTELPGPIEALARLLPASALSDVLRAALNGGADANGAVAVLSAWALGGAALAARTFRWD
jgi:ABC-2 type transport system permease protein